MSTRDMVPPQSLWDARQVALVLNISLFKAREMLRTGEIPRVLIGRCVRAKPEDVAAFIESRRVNGEKP